MSLILPWDEMRFSINRLVVVEGILRKPIREVLEEIQSEAGASLATLRALVAVGRMRYDFAHSAVAPCVDLSEAGLEIERVGVEVAGQRVGAALGKLLAKLDAGS